jgi:hypothetical protein
MAGTDINIELILSEFGKYYEQAGQNRQRLFRALMQAPETLLKLSIPIKTKDTIYRMANFQFQKLMQPFQKAFTPQGGVKFFPNEIRLRQIKIDLDLFPHDIEDSWLGFLGGDSSRDLTSWPIVRWLMEEYIVNQVQEEKELDAIYKGVYNPAGTTPSDTMDGIKQQLLKGVNADYPINVIDGIGEFSEDTIFDQLEEYDEKISELYQGKPLVHYVAQKWVRKFQQAKRANGYYFIDGPNKIDASIDFTAHVVVGLPSMNGTNDIFTTFKDNLIHVTKRDFSLANFDMQKFDRQVKLLLDWWEAVGFACNQMVWTTSETVAGETPPVTSGS